MIDRAMKRVKWNVATEYGTQVTYAATKNRAIRNVKFRIVMGERSYSRPTPRDLALMRDLEVFSCVAE